MNRRHTICALANEKGILLGELVLAVLVAVCLTAAVAGAVRFMTRTSTNFQAKTTAESTVEQLYVELLTTGRLAQQCNKQVDTATSQVTLSCDVIVGSAAPTSTVRFRIDSVKNSVIYEKWNSSLVPPAWETRKTYSGIGNVKLCDETMMKASTCTILPMEVSSRYKSKLENPISGAPAPVTNRFFRFRFEGPILSGVQPKEFQGAFFVRNPSSSYGPLYFAWGTKDETP